MEDNFFNKVYEVVRIIPIGRVTSYGAIGKYLGSAKSTRMVGWALNKCPNDVPAHRVINRNGLLTGKAHFNGINLMQQLLENEGIVVEENKVINLGNNFWDPSKELL
ncbi:MAG TPA: MGMT family protein [Flavobacteriales bacterium]|jgi:methylated-DNA-protein-cysteine methyltransferase-like protein|nr:MGMT family protein [Flavobacteriales bacterium]HIL66861.1 MGMT family protein [Flavobacteriales bacterium]